MLMKKIFTLIAMTFVAISVNAQTLINYPTSKDGTSISGTTDEGTLGDNAAYILKNGYTTSGAYNENSINLATEGGFKTGDVITIAGAIDKDDETKRGTVQIFTMDAEQKITKVHLFNDFENLKFGGQIKEQTYTLEADADKLYFGRDGGTNTFVTKIVITRGGSSGGGTGEKITYASVTFDGTNVVLSPEFAAVVEPVMDTENPEKVKYYKATNAVGGKSVVTAYDKNGVKVVAVGGTTPSSVTPDLTNKIADVKKEDPENPEKVTKGALYALASAEWNDVQWNPTTVGGKGHSMNNGDKDAIYTLDGTGNPYINIFAEEIWTDGEFTGNYRADYEYYEPDGSKGLPTTGLYYSFNSSVAGAFKVMVWANNGSRPTYVVNATTGSEQFAKAQPLLAEGYINGQDWKQEDADAGTIDASLVGKRKYLSAEQINEIHTSGGQKNQYVIGQGNQPFWGYLMFDVNPGDEYWVFQPSSQIGFGGFEFTPGAKKEDLTKIESIQTKTNKVWNPNAPMYNLSGQKVDKSYKGIVIQNGRKFVNK